MSFKRINVKEELELDTEFNYKNHIYSLKQCKEFMREMSGNIEYSENEGILTSCFHYLEEYLEVLKKLDQRNY